MKLNIEGISKYYKNIHAVDNLSVELTPGIYGLVGPNGSGKTTLLRMLSTVLKPSKGRVLLNEQDISLSEENYREQLGYLPQKYGLYRNFTVVKFLMYIGSLKGLDKKNLASVIDELAAKLNLESYLGKKIGTLSEGTKQRIGIVQALLNNPSILILDEPTLNLDPKERINLKNMLSHMSTQKIIIISTHIISDIEFIAKEIILLQKGKKIEQNTPNKLLDNLSGRVWEAEIDHPSLDSIEKNYLITEVKNISQGLKLRILSESKPDMDCVSAEPILDDVYMYYFGEEDSNDRTS